MNLRSRKIATPEPSGPKPPRQKPPPKPPKAGPKGRKPTGVTKAGPSKTGGKKDAKAPSARERAQAAKKTKEAAQKQKQQQKEKDAKNKKKDAAQSKKATGGKPNQPRKKPPRKSPSDPKGRNDSNTSSSTLSSIDSEALAALEPSPNNKKQPVNFWLKPHLKVYTPTKPKDPLSPRSAGVQKVEMKKWGPYALPPFGKPFWQKSRKDGRLELLLPMLVTEDEKDAVEDRGRFGGMKAKFMDEIRRNRGGKKDVKDGAGESGEDDGNQGGDENHGGGEPAGPEDGAGTDGGNGKGREENPIVFFSEEDDEDDDDEEEEGE